MSKETVDYVINGQTYDSKEDALIAITETRATRVDVIVSDGRHYMVESSAPVAPLDLIAILDRYGLLRDK